MNVGQHRLELVQIVNWGTFEGSWTLPVPRAGLLVTGPSGSGKSSLLDAMASVLVQPRWLAFNAAAQEGGTADRHRSLVSYVRGAHKREADDATGEVSTSYLRTGATWSGVALTFGDGAGIRTSLVRLLHMPRGTNAADDLNSLFVLANEEVSLLDLQRFAEDGINARQLKAAHPAWTTHTTYAGFAVKLQRRLGLASDQAQRLLHKTQSAKNLTSLDTLLRDFMLDEPDTFGLADDAVTQFRELSQAHASVVDARCQVERLRPLRGIDKELAELGRRREALAEQERHVGTVVVQMRAAKAESELAALALRVAALARELAAADREVSDREAARDAARSALEGLGGHKVIELDALIELRQGALDGVARHRDEWRARCEELGRALPESEADLGSWLADISTECASLKESSEARAIRYELSDRAAQSKRSAEALRGRLSALSRQRSNLDERLLTVRDWLLESAGVSRDRLPFVGELLDVRPEEARWRGAIERVLHSFARTLLVPDDLYPHVSEFVDRNDLGTRLFYERMLPGADDRGASAAPGSLLEKLQVADAEASEWVRSNLARRFDYRCVESVAELRVVKRGVTLSGQVKHSDTRHEKDDRSRLDNRASWVLGTSTESKRVVLEAELAQHDSQSNDAERTRDRADASRAEGLTRLGALNRLLELTWEVIDLAGVGADVAELRGRRAALLASANGLVDAQRQLVGAESALSETKGQRDEVLGQHRTAEAGVLGLRARLTGWRAELSAVPEPPPGVRQGLVDLLARLSPSLDGAEGLAREKIGADQREVDRLSHRGAGRAERIMQLYKIDWPIPGQDWGINVEFLPDFLGRLDLLEADRLPEFEERFFTLLRTQSQNNIGILSTRLRNARREVRERVDPINASLRLTEYAPGCHLHVRVDDRRLPDVTEFLQTLSAIAGGTLSETLGAGNEAEDRGQAEQRFDRMKVLLTRLASSEPGDVRWRQHCLDTRQHVTFVAEVRGPDGRPVDFFNGAGGLSGGERQKLVIFCLAAALRYQLARDGAEVPSYGLVVLDEAFDKTDPAFTKAGLDVFRQFGFQLMLATPLKMLQTLEDYVGGAAVVLNDSGRGSRLEYLGFGDDPVAASPEDLKVGAQDALL